MKKIYSFKIPIYAISFLVFMMSTASCVKILNMGRPDPSDTEKVETIVNLAKQLIQNVASGENSIEGQNGDKLHVLRQYGRTTRIEQSYQDLRVWGYQIVANTVGDSGDIRVNGKFAYGINEDLGTIDTNSLNTTAALAALKREVFKNSPEPESIEVQDAQSKAIIYIDETMKKAKIAYQVSFSVEPNESNQDPSFPTAILDANFDVILKYDNLQTGPGGGIVG